MSAWTHITGIIRVCPMGRTNPEMRYILETVLAHLPNVTGSEEDMSVTIVPIPGHDSSSNRDEYGQRSNKLVDRYGCHSNRGWMEVQTQYDLVLQANLRDRVVDETVREFTHWLTRLAKRVMVHQVFVRIYGDTPNWDVKEVILKDHDAWFEMFEPPSWSQIRENKGKVDLVEPNWCEHLMWRAAPETMMPDSLYFKYYNDAVHDHEMLRRMRYWHGCKTKTVEKKKEVNLSRARVLLKNAIRAYEFELEQQDYQTAVVLHAVLLNEFGLTEAEYVEIMGKSYSW